MKSMTGFGRAAAECESFSVVADVSSVNKKGLEISVSLPRDWQPLERLIAAKAREFYTRGKVGVSVRADFRGAPALLSGASALESAAAALKAACESVGAKFEPSADTVLKLCELSASDAAQGPDWESAWATVSAALSEAFEKSSQMREAEGENLKRDLATRLNMILELALSAERESRNTAAQYRDRLLARLKDLGLELDLGDERLLKELCIFADKCDVSEEITRLKSHIAQFLSALEERDAVGRKMDFICQEMGREINTMASKANNLELTKIAISLKNELERLREQIQNIE